MAARRARSTSERDLCLTRARADIPRPAATPGSACLPPGRRFKRYRVLRYRELIGETADGGVSRQRPPRQALPGAPNPPHFLAASRRGFC